MSPASGDTHKGKDYLFVSFFSFHSINVPSEWGPSSCNGAVSKSINCFHSINVPSEWGLDLTYTEENILFVSIQLMSPASGDLEDVERKKQHELDKVSIQLMSPASGDFVGD